MRVTRSWVRAVCVAGLITGLAVAQPPGGGGGRGGQGRGFGMQGGGAATLAMNKSVQGEIKLTDEQKTKVQEFGQKQMQEMREKMQDLQDLDREQRQEKMQSIRKEMTAAGDKFLKDTLKPDQYKRLKQIAVQQAGLGALNTDEEVQKALKLTGEQKEKFKAMQDEMQGNMRELFQEMRDNPQEAQSKMAALRKEALAKAVDVLNADQKKEWKELTGAPFEVKMEAGAFGGRGKGKDKPRDPDKDK